MQHKVDSASFRRLMGRFATGIAVVTARNAALGAFGLTVNSLTSVSLDPPLLLFCIDRAAHLYDALTQADRFAVNLLARDQEAVSRHFASRDDPAAIDHLWDAPVGDCPILDGTLGWALCRRFADYPGGDHVILVGEVIDLRVNEAGREPLLYYRGSYRDIAAGVVTSGARK